MVRIKICGLTTLEDALAAAELGADALGFNFYERSPRYIAPKHAEEIVSKLPPFVQAVALFVNRPLDEIAAWARAVRVFQALQYHSEQPGLHFRMALPVLRAFPISDADSLKGLQDFLLISKSLGTLPAAVLVDAHVPGLHGGTGKTAPWDLLAEWQCPVPLILAGGLTPDNVAEAIRRVRPYAVDVASGVESSPGRKDRAKLRRFLDNARAAL